MTRLRYFLLFFVLPLLVLAVFFIYPKMNNENLDIASLSAKSGVVKFGGLEIAVEIVTSPKDRRQGLSGRENLKENAGMLFVFEEPSEHGIWMRGMKFPLDILWLSEGEVVHIVKNALPGGDVPNSQLPIYVPPVPAVYVLELNAGVVDKLGIEIGSQAQILF